MHKNRNINLEEVMMDKLVERRYQFLAQQPEDYGGTYEDVYRNSMFMTVPKQNQQVINQIENIKRKSIRIQPELKNASNFQIINFEPDYRVQNTKEIIVDQQHLQATFERLHVQRYKDIKEQCIEDHTFCTVCAIRHESGQHHQSSKIVQPKLSTQFNPVSSIHQVQQAVKTLMYEEPTTSVFSNLQKTRYQTIKYITKPSQNRPKRKLSNTVIYNTSQRSTQDEINKLLTQLVNK
ncbi:hypothetical protein SS50377_26846 [Spironucleus salmonicida]|uniref:Uncharacterized protein n=1 Tax=Spironucleus salmonicida TaxID=348837 RepID=V6M7A6_9EUKA|nr:hypothetical protein SS50377_26846 [Spironucleus salmonicida]|eukprot:EST49314.1 Hypothetical protein SS50377_10539 [Spironucleus salmonicida]